MWLKKLVGISMIITLIGMNAVVLLGFFGSHKSQQQFNLAQAIPAAVPTVTLSASPTEVESGLFSALSWQVTGEVTSCMATGDWNGVKTPFGSESSGRLESVGTKTYILTCQNKTGKSEAKTTVTVTPAVASKSGQPTPTISRATVQASQQTVYCGGATPCYSAHEIAAHGSAGNCWGWNGDRVIDISSFDASFHKGKSGIGSIEISGICGKDLAPALGGSVSADGQTRNHNSSTKNNADRNMIAYFVGYFDASKP